MGGHIAVCHQQMATDWLSLATHGCGSGTLGPTHMSALSNPDAMLPSGYVDGATETAWA